VVSDRPATHADRGSLVERLWIEYALKVGNYRQMEDAVNQALGDFVA